jgi:branched-chain amino acid transport system permease protein
VRSFSELYNSVLASNAVFSYRQDERIFRTRFKRMSLAGFFGLVVLSPLLLNEGHYFILNLVLTYLIAALGLNLLVGITGLLSLGQAAFVGVGAYTSALLVTNLGFPLALAIPCAGVTAAAGGVIVGVPSLRIKGFYLMVATLAFQFVIDYLIVHWEGLTRGIRGIELSTPVVLGVSLASQTRFFFFVFLVAALMIWGARNLLRSNIGRAFVAIRDNDVSAEIIGIPVFRYKLLSFAIASFYAGVAGAIFSAMQRAAMPQDYSLTHSIMFLAMVLIGGAGSVLGTIFGVIFVTLVPFGLDFIVSWLAVVYDPNVTIYLGPVKDLTFGLLIVLFIIFEPVGLVGVWVRFREYFRIWPLPYISE